MKDADRAYSLRRYSRLKWRVIAELTQYTSKEGANMAAANYARKRGLPWPLPSALSRGEIAYNDRRDGEEWEEIRKTLEFPSIKRCRDAARHYATRYNLEWPPAWIR